MLIIGEQLGHRWAAEQPFLFRDLNLVLHPGSLTALIGPSGSGKSTLLGIIAGATNPTEGTVRPAGVESRFWVLQQPVGVARRTVLDHLALVHLARGMRRREANTRGMSLLERFGLTHCANAQFADLSGGEAQRLMLARAVALAPDLLLVDEPTAQLDAATAMEVAEVLVEVAGPRLTIVATHDPAVERSCDGIVDLGNREAYAT